VENIVVLKKTIKKGNHLISAGMGFNALYTIRTGFFKTSIISSNGQEHLLGFRMTGDSLGMDGIATMQHHSNTIALEDSTVCVFPYAEIENMSRNSPVFLNHFFNLLSRELVRENTNQLMLQMSAEERLAGFIQDLTRNLHARGFSSSEVLLRMTRVEIGQYLGLKLETISRMFTKLAKNGVVSINRKHIHILNPSALEKITGNLN
jgi:CRP/FNR family transcriptional regulator